MGTITKKPWTAEELERLPEGWRYEIDEGELVIMAPAGWLHGKVTNRVAFILSRFVYQRQLGEVVVGESGFFIRRGPDVLRAPDVAFYSTERAARVGNVSGFTTVPPDLAVEVHDPSEPDLTRKIQQFLEAGVRAVWVADPQARTLTRHAAAEPPRTWSSPGAVIEEPVLPGFTCRLDDLFGEGQAGWWT
ncbi:MAG: Uma2 family endonuclease [Bacillota bacterium]